MNEKRIIKRWRTVKSKTPIIGIDDGGFDRFSKEDIIIPVFGVIMKGSAYVDGIIQCHLKRDDSQATTTITQMILDSTHKNQLKTIFLQGITISGFGVLDIVSLYEMTGIPVVVVLRKYPNFPKIKSALEKAFPTDQDRWQSIKRAGDPLKVQENPVVYLQLAGIHPKDAYLLIKECTAVGTIPEALRIAHFIGASYYHSTRQM
ncbi:MAG: DUF99 family protein [Candidatus Heimdallarchaeota archaeon]|nr:MAG: DUF99 family protein [Candidatus Heimdallarchaeota archaeon]